MSCRFYGKSHVVYHLIGLDGPLLRQGGNECALICDSYSPCKMETLSRQPDENRCPIARGELRRIGAPRAQGAH